MAESEEEVDDLDSEKEEEGLGGEGSDSGTAEEDLASAEWW